MSTPAAASSDYGRDYYDEYGRLGPSTYSRDNSKWLEHFGCMANELVRRLQPQSALDVGCAKGFLVECLRDRGVEAYGIDVSEYAVSEVREDIKPYCFVGTAIDSLRRNYDLITCIEVCEHMPDADARQAVRQMTSHTDTILFSSTPSNFAEPTHINVHPIIDWLRLFAEYSFAPDESFDTGFFAYHAVLFRRLDNMPSDQSLCRFADRKIREMVEGEKDYAAELLRIRAELQEIHASNGWKLLTRYRRLRFAVKHPIARALRRLGLMGVSDTSA